MSVQQLNSQIENILTKLNISFKRSGRYLQMCCPIHGGDNPTGLGFHLEKNKWICFTRGCQEEWGSDILGLISGVLQVSRVEANDWILDNVEGFSCSVKNKITEKEDTIYTEQLIKRLLKTDFYLKRGFSQATVDAFEHGKAEAHTMKGRIVFPIRDEKGFARGFSGRWAGKEVKDEKGKTICVTATGVKVPKWKHTSFNKTNYCYRMKEAKPFCKDELIIVESIGNVMRFYDAGFKNCVACMGSFISVMQAEQIIKNTKTVILAFDNDKAGHKAEKQSRELLEAIVNLKTIWPPEGKDWAEISNNEVLTILNK